MTEARPVFLICENRHFTYFCLSSETMNGRCRRSLGVFEIAEVGTASARVEGYKTAEWILLITVTSSSNLLGQGARFYDLNALLFKRIPAPEFAESVFFARRLIENLRSQHDARGNASRRTVARLMRCSVT